LAPAEILAQLQLLLGGPHFKNSRRCQALLQHVVTAAVQGRHDLLKERVIGAEVFGREPDYDTNQDAVVRNAAAEVRKRLAQHYLEPGHEAEIRIELPLGSYLPEFHRPAPVGSPVSPPERARRFPHLLVSVGLVTVGVLAGAAVSWLFRPAPAARTELDAFWAPVVSAPGEAQILLGQSRARYVSGPLPYLPSGELDPSTTVPASRLQPMRDRYIWMGDAFCLARINAGLAARGKASRFRGSAVTPYSEVRGHSAILIGVFNNDWTARLTGGLRFSLVNLNEEVRGVRDSLHASELKWKMTRGAQGWMGEEDYALVSRFYSPETEQVVVIAGGIGHFGTMAAGDFLANPAYFHEAAKSAPQDWERRNMQFVLRVKIADGSPSAPELLATHFW
jgi:hypothetical protein